MKEFKGKVAVITDPASGIGRGLAERCVAEGMKVVLADIEEGMSPSEVAGHVFEAIRENRFYILTHPGFSDTI